jgi:glycosyltransferase involved in cell wall biosynthesis
LTQTVTDLEVIVVIDGPDPQTAAALKKIDDSRLRTIALEENVGGSEARNVGARHARAKWIALLDDDDEWLPNRLDTQLRAAEEIHSEYALIASRFLERGAKGDVIQPRKFIKPGQHVSEFLYSEISMCGGIVGFPQMSTWLVSRRLLLDVPFTKGLKCLQDMDWVLRALQHPATQVRFVPEPLAIFHNDVGRDRVTKNVNWKYSYDWAMRNRTIFSPKGLAFFIVVFCINPAARQDVELRVLLSMLRDCRRFGRLTPKLLWLFCLYTVTHKVLRKLIGPVRSDAAIFRIRETTKLAR